MKRTLKGSSRASPKRSAGRADKRHLEGIGGERATAFSATTLPFEELDNGGFEEYCSALLNLHPTVFCDHGGKPLEQRIASAVRQLGGRISQRGIDIRAKTSLGEEWLFQCKHVRSIGEEEA